VANFSAFSEPDRLRPDIFGHYPGRTGSLNYPPAQPPSRPDFREVAALAIDSTIGSVIAAGPGPAFPVAPLTDQGPAFLSEDSSIGGNWFEKVHIEPRTPPALDFGNIISTQEKTFELFSAFRRQTVQLTTFTNNAGAGILIPDLPSLPFPQPPFTSILDPASIRLGPLPLKVQATPDGPATFNNSLDFLYNLGAGTLKLFIKGDRIALITAQPSGRGQGQAGSGFDEILEFATNIQAATAGKEKRDSFRKNPRQLINYPFSLDGLDRQLLQALLFEWHQRTFAVPVWWEQVRLTTAIVGGATSTADVEDLTFVDMRVGQLAVVFKDNRTFDVIEVLSKTASQVTFISAIQNSYAIGDLVVPVRLAHARPSVQGRRFPVTAEEFIISFRVTDNDTGIPAASTAAFSSFGGKVLLDDCNLIEGTMSESFERRLFVIDSESGIVSQDSPWDRDKRVHNKGFSIRSRQQLFELRQLLLSIRGQQISFWIPSFAEDLTASQDLVATQNTIDVDNIGYTRFIQDRQPKATFRITFTDGTNLVRTITSSVELSGTEERLTLDGTWPVNRMVSEITRIEFYELVRFATDSLRIQHQTIIGRARMTAPVRTVFDNV